MLVVTSHKIVGPTKFPFSYPGTCQEAQKTQFLLPKVKFNTFKNNRENISFWNSEHQRNLSNNLVPQYLFHQVEV